MGDLLIAKLHPKLGNFIGNSLIVIINIPMSQLNLCSEFDTQRGGDP